MKRITEALRTANHWLLAQFVFGIFAVLRLMSADRALAIAERLGRRCGPWIGRHRVAVDNLRQAYPEKSPEEIEAIASDMWANMARLGAEYVFLDQLFDYSFDDPDNRRVEVVGIDNFVRIRDEAGPKILITAHTGSFEMFPVAAAAFGLDLASLFRAPNNPFIARQLMTTRDGSGSRMVASRAGAAFTLARVLDAGGNIGVLVDQKFHNGIRTTFFGRPCETSPLVPRLARQYDAAVFPARCIRLPGNRYRLEIQDRLELPRDADGGIDPTATAQLINDVVEGWVREHPGQWMWFHRRWEIRNRRKRRGKPPTAA